MQNLRRPELFSQASGLPGYEAAFMASVLAPAKTPTSVITRLNLEFVRVLSQPEVKEQLLNAGAEAVASTPEQLAVRMRSEIAKWGKAIKDAGIQIE